MASLSGPDDCVTSPFIHEIHRDSGVNTIAKPFSTSNSPSRISVSIAERSVAIHHSGHLVDNVIEGAIRDAGVNIVKPPAPNVYSSQNEESHQKQDIEAHGAFELGKEDSEDKPSQRSPSVLVSRSNAQISQPNPLYSNPQPISFDSNATLIAPSDGTCILNLSIGGMTCSACSTTVTNALSEISGVTEVSVSLLSNSARVLLDNQKMADSVVSAVEDCGFEAQIITMEFLKAPGQGETPNEARRTVSIRVDKMISLNCAQQVLASLSALDPRITIIKPLTDLANPILQLAYEPDAPSLTIRTIMSAISSSRYPELEVSIHKNPTLEDLAHHMRKKEQANLLRRLLFTVIVAIPTFVLAVVYGSLVKSDNSRKKYLMEPMWIGNISRLNWALFILATPVMFYSANIFHRRSIKEIRSLWKKGSRIPILKRFIRFGSMNFLVSSGVTVAYMSSIVLLALAASQPPSYNKIGDSTTYFDCVVFLTVFLLAGVYLEAYSKTRTADSITALRSLRPSEALLVVPQSHRKSFLTFNVDVEKGHSDLEDFPSADTVQRVDVRHLEIGDIVRVLHGATPPCDGTIVAGHDGAFDESSLTGESRPVRKRVGDQVFVGTINKSKAMDIRVDAIDSATMLGKIIDVVIEGQTRKAPIERVADFITGYFVPVVTLLAISTWLIWLGLGVGGLLPQDYLDIPTGGWTVWSLEFAIAVFVVACPCGIGLAAPTALLVGSGLAAKFGILARGGGEAFQDMAKVDLVVFDKTGTLTEGGDVRVSDVEIFSSKATWTREAILGVAAAFGTWSTHPLATAIRIFSENQAVLHVQGSDVEETPGRGLRGSFQTLKCRAIIGNEAWMVEHGVTIPSKITQVLAVWKSEAKSIVLLAVQDETKIDGRLDGFTIVAIFATADPVRREARDVISAFHKRNISTWMISGDNVITAMSVAAAVGIPKENVIAGVLPQEKADMIVRLQRPTTKIEHKWKLSFRSQKPRDSGRHVVAMVGDGINDASALSIADVGIAIGSGSDVAISSASFVLLSSNLRGLLTLRDLSCKILKRIKFNFLWALCYNLAALPIAAGVLYPFGHIRLNPVWASLAMALSSISVVCSSLLLRLYKEPRVSEAQAA